MRLRSIVTPEEFAAGFVEEAGRREISVKRVWSKASALTRLFLSEKNGVLANVAEKLGLKYCREYYGVDAIMCERVDGDNFPTAEGWFAAERLNVVIEHENRVWGAKQEINKLSIYNSPLKVLITYPWSVPSDYLSAYADILRRGDIFDDFSSKRRHLVLFATWPDQHVRWESYVYRRGKFRPLGGIP